MIISMNVVFSCFSPTAGDEGLVNGRGGGVGGGRRGGTCGGGVAVSGSCSPST